MTNDLVSVNILNTNESKYLRQCLDAVLAQTYQPLEVVVIDNNSVDDSRAILAEYGDRIRVIPLDRNHWYCGGHNVGIRETDGEFIQVLNVDVFIEPDFVERMVRTIRSDDRAAAVQGKIYQHKEGDPTWKQLDTVGIRITRARRNFDKGQGEQDTGQYDHLHEIFGADGVAPLYRRTALEDVRFEDEHFDEDFLIYREVVDLSWRLHRRDWKTLFDKDAIGRHVRGFSPKTRHQQSDFVKQLSYRNRLLTIVKNDDWGLYLQDGLRSLAFDIAFLGHIALRERHLVKAFGQFRELLPRALKKRAHIRERALRPNHEVTALFE